jgi:hypothetical protein
LAFKRLYEKQNHPLRDGFLNGAGSIRAYSYAENTGLVISDVAEIGTIFDISKLSGNFFAIYPSSHGIQPDV